MNDLPLNVLLIVTANRQNWKRKSLFFYCFLKTVTVNLLLIPDDWVRLENISEIVEMYIINPYSLASLSGLVCFSLRNIFAG